MALSKVEYPTEPVYPALHIPASDEDLKVLGELCAIQGQIEFLMQLTVMVLSKTSIQRARKHMSSSNIAANAAYWLNIIEKSSIDEKYKLLAQTIVSEINVIKDGRNNFVHAVYGLDAGEGGFSVQVNTGVKSSLVSESVPVAVHNLKVKPMGNLKSTRDKAAFLSQFILGIYNAAAATASPSKSGSAPD